MSSLRCNRPYDPLCVGCGDEVIARVDEVLYLRIRKRVSVHGNDARPLAAGELNAVRAMDDPVVPIEALAPEVKRRATSYEQRATSY